MAEQRSDRIALADSILREALDRPPEERKQIVEERCAGDASMGESLLRLISQFDKLGDFLEQPAKGAMVPGPELQPGTTLMDGRFRIEGLAGRGGMGYVYRAWDNDTGGTVAVKTLRPAWREEEGARSRFQNEIRMARGVSHPNICATFELFTDRAGSESLLFFTMPFLEGETLAQRMARGRMPLEEIAAVAEGIAAGLDAAHREGIVHRDLKPANVMLRPERGGGIRPVIMDFGLAASAAASGGEELAGSPDYMAPEQFLGGELTPATDVYALGAMVFEMAAGKRPFPAEPLFRMALRRVSADLPAAAVAEVPAKWRAAVKRAMAREAGDRFQTAGEFAARLRGPRVTRRTAAAAIAAAAVASAAAILRYKNREGMASAAPAVLLMPCGGAGKDSQQESLGRIVDLLMQAQLGQSARVRVIGREEIGEAWKLIGRTGAANLAEVDAQTARHIALRAARANEAPFVIFEQIAGAGDSYSLLVTAERVGNDPGRAAEVKSSHWEFARAAELPEASYASATWVRKTVGESAGEMDGRSRRPEELTTPEWQALREYELGDSAWSAGNPDGCLLHLKAATELDPEFAYAEARLADRLLTLGRPDDAYGHWARAAQLTVKRNLTDRESLSIRGRFALDVGLYAEAEEAFSRYALEFPEDALPLFYKADAVWRQGRPEQAGSLLNEAIQRNGRSTAFLLDRAALSLAGGDGEAAQRDWERASRLANGDWLDVFAAGIGVGRGRIEEVGAALERMRRTGSRDFVSRAYALEACWKSERGDEAEAPELLRAGIAFDRTNGLARPIVEQKQRLLAESLLAQGKDAEAVKVCRAALDGVSGLQMQLRLGSVLAKAGDIAGARRSRPNGTPPWPAYGCWANLLEGEIALAGGQAQKALEAMKRAERPAAMRVWPDHVVRAAMAAKDYETAGEVLGRLAKSPGLYWLAAEQNRPGMLRWAAGVVEKAGKWPDLTGEYRRFARL